MMEASSVVVLEDLKDNPRVFKDLPSPLRIGDHVFLQFLLRKRVGPHTEELHVDGEFKITGIKIDARGSIPRQHLLVASTGVAPMWKRVKQAASKARTLPPARSPRTEVV